MAQHNEYFSAENVDEQVERLSQRGDDWLMAGDDTAEQLLLHDLCRLYHAAHKQRQHTLERAWQSLAEQRSARSFQKLGGNFIQA